MPAIGADDVGQKTRHRAEDPEHEPGGRVIGRVIARRLPAALGLFLDDLAFKLLNLSPQSFEFLKFVWGVHVIISPFVWFLLRRSSGWPPA